MLRKYFFLQFAGLTINGMRNPAWGKGLPREQHYKYQVKLSKEDKKEEVFADYELISHIEDHLNQGNYISYAQKRFSKNGGVPNPLTANDDFTKTFLTMAD